MELYNSVKTVFDSSQNLIIDREWTICESDDNASLKALKISGIQTGSYSIDKDLYSNRFEKIFDKSSKLNDIDCDGCAIVHHNQKKYMVLVELKSGFDASKIYKAYQQTLVTLLKNHMLFSLCGGYDIKKYDAIILIACLPPDKNTEVWLNYTHMLMQNASENVKRDCCFATKLYFEKKLHTKMRDITFLGHLSFADTLKDLNIHIALKTPSTINDTTLEISVESVL